MAAEKKLKAGTIKKTESTEKVKESKSVKTEKSVKKSVINKSVATNPAASKSTATKPAATKPAATKPVATKPAATKPAATKPAATKLAASKPPAKKQTANKSAAQKKETPISVKASKMTTEMPIVKHTLPSVPLSDLPLFPISKKPDNRINFKAIWEILQQLYPKPNIELDFQTPFELLAATVLSAQCTDVQVNAVTQKLFKKYKTIEDYAYANPAEFEKDIYSTGFYRMKAKHIIESANLILKDFNGEVPSTMTELTKLPGVGRKTANIVLSRGFGIIDGIAVDTHVKRLSGKIGFTEYEDPEKIEKDLMKLADKKDYDDLSLTLIFHGRRVCDAQRPRCDVCAIQDLCPSAFI